MKKTGEPALGLKMLTAFAPGFGSQHCGGGGCQDLMSLLTSQLCTYWEYMHIPLTNIHKDKKLNCYFKRRGEGVSLGYIAMRIIAKFVILGQPLCLLPYSSLCRLSPLAQGTSLNNTFFWLVPASLQVWSFHQQLERHFQVFPVEGPVSLDLTPRGY